MAGDWSRLEVEATVSDYLAMLTSELAGVPYNKTTHRNNLLKRLKERSPQSVEFKHANISAVLIELGFPYISGYKPRSNYQKLLYETVAQHLAARAELLGIAATNADQPIVVPEVDDILQAMTAPPAVTKTTHRQPIMPDRPSFSVNYLEREAHNQSLGAAGEIFALNYERARLIHNGREKLADRIEHTSRTRGDTAGFDIQSYEVSGEPRFIEVKTTRYGCHTPFFVSRNECEVSAQRAAHYHLYRLYDFRDTPRLFSLAGALKDTCDLTASTYVARAR